MEPVLDSLTPFLTHENIQFEVSAESYVILCEPNRLECVFNWRRTGGIVFMWTRISLLVGIPALALAGSGYTQYCWTEGTRRLEVNVRGTVEFSDDDRDVKSLSSGGYFQIEENRLLVFTGRRYEVTADSSGRLSRVYFGHGHAMPLDNQGQAWLMGVMPEVIRHTGLGAVPRVQRILKQSGVAGVLSEVSRIQDDSAKRIYLEELIRRGNLSTEQLDSALLQARKIGSNEEKGEFLIELAPYFLKDKLRESLFQAAGTIGSDEEHGRVLSELVKRDAGNHETLRLAARAAGRIGSDEEKARVLVDIAEHEKGARDVERAIVNSANSIGSDEERHHILSVVLGNAGGDREVLAEALRSAAAIGSDEEKAAVLIDAAGHYVEADAVRKEFFSAAGRIGSDEARGKVLLALLKRAGLGDATLAETARCAEAIGSDEQKAAVLAAYPASSLQGAPQIAAYFKSLDTVGSDEEHERVLSQLLKQRSLANAAVLRAIESAGKISSDELKAKVLSEAAGTFAGDPQVRAALAKALDSIQSDSEYRRLASALAQAGTGKH
jgi:hypothetical protein